MAFHLTFENITSRNIKHIYSGLPDRKRFHCSGENPTLTQMNRSKEEEDHTTSNLRTNDFNSEYNCLVPRAPAFRTVSKAEADDIVERVRRPTKAATWKSEGTDGNTRLDAENAKEDEHKIDNDGKDD